MADQNNAAQAAMQNPIDEAIVILTEEADSLSECHTRTPGDWAGEPEAKARYDHILAVVDALSELRAPVADERAATAPLCHVRSVGDGWQVCPSTHPDARAVSPVDAPHDSDSVCAWRVWWNQHKSRFTTARQASFAAFAAGKEWRGAALESGPVAGDARPAAYLTLDEEGSPCMLFFDVVEARGYCAPGEEPEPLFRHAAPRASAEAEIASYGLADGTRVERAAQMDGTYLWAVRRDGNCLGLDGHWNYEPLPSSRGDEWLALHRFPTAQAAIRALKLPQAATPPEQGGRDA